MNYSDRVRAYFSKPEPFWGYYRVGKRMLAVPKKCGSTSFKHNLCPGMKNAAEFFAATRRIGPYSLQAAMATGLPLVLGVRDPVARFASLWKDAQRKPTGTFGAFHGLTPDELLDIVEAYIDADPHFAPQSRLYTDGVTVVPHGRLLAEMGGAWKRRTGGAEGMLVDRIRRLYREDFDLVAMAS